DENENDQHNQGFHGFSLSSVSTACVTASMPFRYREKVFWTSIDSALARCSRTSSNSQNGDGSNRSFSPRYLTASLFEAGGASPMVISAWRNRVRKLVTEL